MAGPHLGRQIRVSRMRGRERRWATSWRTWEMLNIRFGDGDEEGRAARPQISHESVWVRTVSITRVGSAEKNGLDAPVAHI